MPIRPENRDRYPENWAEISFNIRLIRALGHCECEGECGTGHAGRCPARHNGAHPVTGSKVVLTVAHLDHTPENCDPTNLKAFCQRCHLAYDADEHAATRARTKAAETAAWNTPLPGLEPAAAPAARPAVDVVEPAPTAPAAGRGRRFERQGLEYAEWEDRAACREVGTDTLFGNKGYTGREAKAICKDCVVKPDCLEMALATDWLVGIWGGTSKLQRDQIRKKRAKRAAA